MGKTNEHGGCKVSVPHPIKDLACTKRSSEKDHDRQTCMPPGTDPADLGAVHLRSKLNTNDAIRLHAGSADVHYSRPRCLHQGTSTSESFGSVAVHLGWRILASERST